MKKVLLLILATVVILSGCIGTTDESKTKNEQGGRETVVINIPTAATTGALYPLGSSLAKLWNDELGYVKANAQASNGGIDNLNLLQSGEAQVSMAVTSIMYQSYKGEAVFEGRPNKN